MADAKKPSPKSDNRRSGSDGLLRRMTAPKGEAARTEETYRKTAIWSWQTRVIQMKLRRSRIF